MNKCQFEGWTTLSLLRLPDIDALGGLLMLSWCLNIELHLVLLLFTVPENLTWSMIGPVHRNCFQRRRWITLPYP